ncbi:putative lachesin, partial [Operophtera brumata]
VAWIRADDQTILTLHTRLVTHSSRYAVSNDSPRSWHLHIRPLKVEDRGLPPNIVDEGTSSDLVSQEGHDSSLSCKAEGRPLPRILWRREDGTNIQLRNEIGELKKVAPTIIVSTKVIGKHEISEERISQYQMRTFLVLTEFSSQDAGTYTCVATNTMGKAEGTLRLYDTMQNVIEQSVLDNNWLPTAESTGSSAHQALPLPTLALLSMLPYVKNFILSSLSSFSLDMDLNNFKYFTRRVR